MTAGIKFRLAATIAGMLALLAGMWIAATLSTNALSASYSHSVQHIDAISVAVSEGSKLRDDEETALRGYLLTGQKVFLAPYTAALAAAPALQKQIDALIADDSALRPLILNRRRIGGIWGVWAAGVIKNPLAYPRASSHLIAQQLQGKALFDQYRAATTDITTALDREQEHDYSDSLSLLAHVRLIFALLFAGAMVTALLLGWRTMLAVTRPLSRLSRAAQAIGEGDLDRPVRIEGAREFADLGTSMEWMRNQLALQARLVVEREMELRAGEERFRSAFELAAGGMAMVGLDGRWIRVNAALCDSLGYSESELLTMTSAAVTHPQDRPSGANATRGLLDGSIPTILAERRFIHKDGHTLWVHIGSVVVRDAQGAPLNFIAQITNISERKQAEAALQANKQELERSNAELQQFAYVASHDLQEPLRTISSYLQLLNRRYKGKPLDDNAEQFITFAVGGAKRMQTLIQDLLSYSKAGAHSRDFTPTDSGALMAEVTAALRTTIVEKGAVVQYEGLPTMLGDAGQLGRLFQNLIANALKFCKEAPVIRITAERREEQWLFTVRDNGIGIDPAHAARIFVIFQRLHTREEYEGTGLGLALCKKIVERHGGRIWVESVPGQGAAFHFTLPALPVEKENAA